MKIRRDITVSESSVFGKPVFETAPKSRAAQDYLELAKELLQRM
jgi:chromosome partitioning protein